jgi:hypothetical protein
MALERDLGYVYTSILENLILYTASWSTACPVDSLSRVESEVSEILHKQSSLLSFSLLFHIITSTSVLFLPPYHQAWINFCD